MPGESVEDDTSKCFGSVTKISPFIFTGYIFLNQAWLVPFFK